MKKVDINIWEREVEGKKIVRVDFSDGSNNTQTVTLKLTADNKIEIEAFDHILQEGEKKTWDFMK